MAFSFENLSRAAGVIAKPFVDKEQQKLAMIRSELDSRREFMDYYSKQTPEVQQRMDAAGAKAGTVTMRRAIDLIKAADAATPSSPASSPPGAGQQTAGAGGQEGNRFGSQSAWSQDFAGGAGRSVMPTAPAPVQAPVQSQTPRWAVTPQELPKPAWENGFNPAPSGIPSVAQSNPNPAVGPLAITPSAQQTSPVNWDAGAIQSNNLQYIRDQKARNWPDNKAAKAAAEAAKVTPAVAGATPAAPAADDNAARIAALATMPGVTAATPDADAIDSSKEYAAEVKRIDAEIDQKIKDLPNAGVFGGAAIVEQIKALRAEKSELQITKDKHLQSVAITSSYGAKADLGGLNALSRTLQNSTKLTPEQTAFLAKAQSIPGYIYTPEGQQELANMSFDSSNSQVGQKLSADIGGTKARTALTEEQRKQIPNQVRLKWKQFDDNHKKWMSNLDAKYAQITKSGGSSGGSGSGSGSGGGGGGVAGRANDRLDATYTTANRLLYAPALQRLDAEEAKLKQDMILLNKGTYIEVSKKTGGIFSFAKPTKQGEFQPIPEGPVRDSLKAGVVARLEKIATLRKQVNEYGDKINTLSKGKVYVAPRVAAIPKAVPTRGASSLSQNYQKWRKLNPTINLTERQFAIAFAGKK